MIQWTGALWYYICQYPCVPIIFGWTTCMIKGILSWSRIMSLVRSISLHRIIIVNNVNNFLMNNDVLRVSVWERISPHKECLHRYWCSYRWRCLLKEQYFHIFYIGYCSQRNKCSRRQWYSLLRILLSICMILSTPLSDECFVPTGLPQSLIGSAIRGVGLLVMGLWGELSR